MSDSPTPPAETGARERIRLGSDYYKLWTATAISTTGDGVYYAALPLLAATLTRDPLVVSVVFFAEELPWLLISLPAGILVDRVDRRRLLWLVDAARFVVVATLGVAVLMGWATIPLLAVAGFLLGIGRTLYDNGAQAIVPALVSRDPARLERASGRMASVELVGGLLAGPPVGGLMFVAAPAVPFLADAVSFAAGSALIAAIPGRYTPRHGQHEGRMRLRTEITEGLRWLWRHRLLRTLAVMVGVLNLAMAAWSGSFVLFAQDQLGVGGAGYGVLLTGLAVGGVLGGLVAARLSRRFGPAPLLLTAVAGEGLVLMAMGLMSNPWLVGVLLIVLGIMGVVWNTISISLRQQIVPEQLFGRVNSVYKLVGMGLMPLGALLGGTLARVLDLRAPFLLGAGSLLAMLLFCVPVVNTATIRAAQAEAGVA